MVSDDNEQGVVMATARGDLARLVVSGRLGPAGVDRLRGLLDDVHGPGAVVSVDLAHAAVLPVAVLRALAATHRRLRDGGGGLVVEQPSAAAVRTLRTSGLHHVLQIQGWPAAKAPAPDQTAAPTAAEG